MIKWGTTLNQGTLTVAAFVHYFLWHLPCSQHPQYWKYTTYLCLLCFSFLADKMDKVRQGIMTILWVLCWAVLGMRLLIPMLGWCWCLLVVAGCSTCCPSSTGHGSHRAMLRCQACWTHTEQAIRKSTVHVHERNSLTHRLCLSTNTLNYFWHQKTNKSTISQAVRVSIKKNYHISIYTYAI